MSQAIWGATTQRIKDIYVRHFIHLEPHLKVSSISKGNKYFPNLQDYTTVVITRNPEVYAALSLVLRPAPEGVDASLQDVSSWCGQPQLILTTSPTGSPEQ